MDKITIKDASFPCNVGVSSKERSRKQDILIDVELFLDTKKAAGTDDIKHTINYAQVHKLVGSIVRARRYKLIETIAESIAKKILENFNVGKVVVRIKKRPDGIKIGY